MEIFANNDSSVDQQHRDPMEMQLEIQNGFENEPAILELFEEYIHFLSEVSPGFQIYLDLQHYDQEIQDLHQKYGEPEGRLYLAVLDGQPVGCIALKPIFEQDCEMKRLYVRPACRGKGIGRQLIQKIVQEARQMGYRWMYLDSLPILTAALHLYEEAGFSLIDAYNDSPVDETLFLRKTLSEPGPEK